MKHIVRPVLAFESTKALEERRCIMVFGLRMKERMAWCLGVLFLLTDGLGQRIPSAIAIVVLLYQIFTEIARSARGYQFDPEQ